MVTPAILRAAEHMCKVHDGHVRKYTGEPYVVHCLSVARMVWEAGYGDDVVIAALLHDSVEDWPQRTSFPQVEMLFGRRVRDLVMQVTNVSRPSDGNRAVRKEIDRRHFSAADPEGQSIKLADMIDNARTILLHDESFAKTFFAEKKALLESMTLGDRNLRFAAQRMVNEYYAAQEVRP